MRPSGRPGARLLLAVDIGATKTLVTVRDVQTLRDTWGSGPVQRFPTPGDPLAAVDAVVHAARTLARDAAGRIVAVGVVAPGPLDARTGVVDHSPNLGWRDVPLVALLRERLEVPVVLDDDATAAALGEARFGAGRGADPFAYLTISSGVGAGVVTGGRSLRGAHGLAGEVGHLVVDPAGPRCGCGRRGDVEAYAGGASLGRRARATWPASRLADGTSAPRDAAGVFRMARGGDPSALGLVEDAVAAVAHALAALSAVIDPAVIAMGGSLALGQPGLRRRASTLARQLVMAETGRGLTVVPAMLGEASCLAGAAALGFDLIGR